jgi:hypothetical protein
MVIWCGLFLVKVIIPVHHTAIIRIKRSMFHNSLLKMNSISEYNVATVTYILIKSSDLVEIQE